MSVSKKWLTLRASFNSPPGATDERSNLDPTHTPKRFPQEKNPRRSHETTVKDLRGREGRQSGNWRVEQSVGSPEVEGKRDSAAVNQMSSVFFEAHDNVHVHDLHPTIL